jgi:penicillin-binding protein 1A
MNFLPSRCPACLRNPWLWLALPPLLGMLYVLILIPFTPSISDIRKATQDDPALILSADGQKLTEIKRANREWVALEHISPDVVDALIATEDHRFYEHHGLDWRRLVSSILHTLSGDRQGGSTITQQLARNLYPEEVGRSATLTRKLKEAITALKIESVHSKHDILETYLNTVPFLYNAFGIEMAARTYFDTSARELTVLQGATLVGMLKGNSYYNPVLNPERAQERRNIVLAQMVKRGKLDDDQYQKLQKQALGIDFERQPEQLGIAPHFTQPLRQWLIDWADRHDYNLYADGLVVHTTLDSRLQKEAVAAVERHTAQLQRIADDLWNPSVWRIGNPRAEALVRESSHFRKAVAGGEAADAALKRLLKDAAFIKALRAEKVRMQAGFVAIDPRNGEIRAWVGSRDYATDAFDHVRQARRQPGSTFKPFVYGEAFRQGRSPSDMITDETVEIITENGDIWSPSDEKAPSGKPMSLRTGITYSKNTITAQLMDQVGIKPVIELAQKLGVRESKLEAVPSLALGTSPVTLLEMVTAYASIANQGGYLPPRFVARIEDRNGKVLETFTAPAAESALDAQVAYTLLDTLRSVVDRGTASDIRNRYGIYADVAGKTGTTQDNADGWFILMHPQLVAGAWAGFNDNRITLNDYWGLGSRSALPVVGEFFRAVLGKKLIDEKARFGTPEQQAALRLPQAPIASVASEIASAPEEAEPAASESPPTPASAPEAEIVSGTP